MLSKEARRDLKAAGWKLQRHTRNRREMWVFDKVDWPKTYTAWGGRHPVLAYHE